MPLNILRLGLLLSIALPACEKAAPPEPASSASKGELPSVAPEVVQPGAPPVEPAPEQLPEGHPAPAGKLRADSPCAVICVRSTELGCLQAPVCEAYCSSSAHQETCGAEIKGRRPHDASASPKLGVFPGRARCGQGRFLRSREGQGRDLRGWWQGHARRSSVKKTARSKSKPAAKKKASKRAGPFLLARPERGALRLAGKTKVPAKEVAARADFGAPIAGFREAASDIGPILENARVVEDSGPSGAQGWLGDLTATLRNATDTWLKTARR